MDGRTACNNWAAALTHANAMGCAAMKAGVNTAAPIVPARVNIKGPYCVKEFIDFPNLIHCPWTCIGQWDKALFSWCYFGRRRSCSAMAALTANAMAAVTMRS